MLHAGLPELCDGESVQQMSAAEERRAVQRGMQIALSLPQKHTEGKGGC